MKNEPEETSLADAEPYIELFEALRNRVGDDAIAVAVMHELSKDRRMAELRAERQTKLDAFERERATTKPRAGQRVATKKQLDFLRDLGVEPRADMTSDEASRAIDAAQAKRRVA
jgi:phage gp37-like protein